MSDENKETPEKIEEPKLELVEEPKIGDDKEPQDKKLEVEGLQADLPQADLPKAKVNPVVGKAKKAVKVLVDAGVLASSDAKLLLNKIRKNLI